MNGKAKQGSEFGKLAKPRYKTTRLMGPQKRKPLEIGGRRLGIKRATSNALVSPIVQSVLTLAQLHDKNTLYTDPTALADALCDQVRAVQDGDMRVAEKMLATQAHTLDALFNALVQRAHANAQTGQYLQAADIYMKLALRAQSQARATWEAVSLIKHPPVTIYKQENYAQGHQQVNNGALQHTSRARGESGNAQSKLLENQTHGDGLDRGTAQATGSGDTPLETVGKVNRTPDARRKG